jgi:hypothetical protein
MPTTADTANVFEFRYLGEQPFTVDEQKLAALLERDDRPTSIDFENDIEAGEGAVALIDRALVSDAIVVPAGIRLEVHGSDDDAGSGIYLLMGCEGQALAPELTSGWIDVKRLVPGSEERERATEEEQIRYTIDSTVYELNQILAACSLTIQARILGLDAEALDEVIHDLFASRASDVNNGGLSAQLGEIANAMHHQAAATLLGDLARARAQEATA